MATDDIKSGWLKIARRLQSAMRRNNEGCAIVHIDVLVQGDQPVFWTSPEIVKLEPKSTTTAELLDRLNDLCGIDGGRDVLRLLMRIFGH